MLLCAAGLALCGCSSPGSNLLPPLNSGATPSQSEHPVAVALPQIVGAPQNFLEPFIRQLNQSATAHNVALLVDPSLDADYTLRGYFISNRDGDGVKLLYVWDVLDKSGTRLNRVEGEERIAVSGSSDAWAAVPANVQSAIADRTITGFVAAVQPSQQARKAKH